MGSCQGNVDMPSSDKQIIDISTLRMLNQTAHTNATENEMMEQDHGAAAQSNASVTRMLDSTLFENSFVGQYQGT